MPAGGLTSEMVGAAVAVLWLLELVYWLAFVAVARALFYGVMRRRWFDVVSGLALAIFVWPWSLIAAPQLAFLLF